MRAVLAALLLLLCSNSAALAEERVIQMSSEISIRANGSIIVRDTIDVMVEGKTIKRGLLYGFDAHYTARRPPGADLPVHVQDIQRDGQAEPHVLESTEWGPRLKIGRVDVLLPHGQHRYVIAYCLEQQFLALPNAQILDRNVTSRWPFPIDHY
jgi:hypothetical protein